LVTDVPLLSTRDLREFTMALREAKSSGWSGYKGSSQIVASALTPLRTSKELLKNSKIASEEDTSL
jgi:hypothetical protein